MAYGGLWLLNVKYMIPLALLIVVVDILPILRTGSVLVPWAAIVWAQENHHLGVGTHHSIPGHYHHKKDHRDQKSIQQIWG